MDAMKSPSHSPVVVRLLNDDFLWMANDGVGGWTPRAVAVLGGSRLGYAV